MKIHETIYPCFLQQLDPNKIKCCDGDGNSLLHMAVEILQPDLCSTLIKAGCSVEALNNEGNSPLFELFSNVDNRNINDVIIEIFGQCYYFIQNIENVIATLNVLIESGIDVNQISNSGITAFQGASQWNSERLLIFPFSFVEFIHL